MAREFDERQINGREFTRAEHYGDCYLPASEILSAINYCLEADGISKRELLPYLSDVHERDIEIHAGLQFGFMFVSDRPFHHIEWAHASDTEVSSFEGSTEAKLSGRNVILQAVNPVIQSDYIDPRYLFLFRKPIGYEPQARTLMMEIAEFVSNQLIGAARERMELAEASFIFLSHKSTNKALVYLVADSLRRLNLRPWVDEERMPAGIPLFRGIADGFEKTCAAVFFVSQDFNDENVIAYEVELALARKQKMEDKFASLCLVLKEHGGTRERVPAILRQLVWKDVADAEISTQIIRALPKLVQQTIKYHDPI